MKYKFSKYTVVSETEDLILYNGLHEFPEFLKFNKEDADIIRSLWDKEEIEYINIPLYDFLIEKNILVDKNLNELEYINYQYNKQAYGTKELLLSIVPTEACNMHCVYCYQDHDPQFMSDDGYEAILKFIRYNLYKYKSLEIGWFGGEPLLCKDKIISFLKKANEICAFFKKPIRCEMTTNGLLLDLKTFETLLELGVTSYQITIDGFEEIHNKQRKTNDGSNGYQTILNNLDIIKRHCNKRFDIMIRTNFLLENAKVTQDFLIFLHNRFASDKRFDFNLQSVRDWGKEVSDKLKITPYEDSNNLLNQLLEKDIDPLSKRISEIKQICPACCISYYFINWDLSIHKCSIALHNNHKNSNIGRLTKRGLLEIDTYKEMLWVERGKIPQKCLDCSYYALCFSNKCPYSYKIKLKKNCEEFKFSINEKIKYISAELPYVDFKRG